MSLYESREYPARLAVKMCDIMELCTIFRYSFICRSAHACSLLGVSTFGACARSDWEESSRVTLVSEVGLGYGITGHSPARNFC